MFWYNTILHFALTYPNLYAKILMEAMRDIKAMESEEAEKMKVNGSEHNADDMPNL